MLEDGEMKTSEAEAQDTETKATEEKASQGGSKPVDDDKINSSKIVDKLKSRLGKEQSEKHSALNQLAELKKEFEQLKAQKSVKGLSDEERTKKELSEKDKRIAELEANLKHRDAVAEVNGVFKESGINVSESILDMVTTADPETTYSNAQAVIDLINDAREDAKKDFLKGTTPKKTGAKIEPKKPASKMTLLERVQLKKNDPEAFRQMFKR